MNKIKKFAKILGSAIGICLKYFIFSGLASVWYWLPILTLCKYMDEN